MYVCGHREHSCSQCLIVYFNDSESEWTHKPAVTARHLSGRTEENKKIPQSGSHC